MARPVIYLSAACRLFPICSSTQDPSQKNGIHSAWAGTSTSCAMLMIHTPVSSIGHRQAKKDDDASRGEGATAMDLRAGSIIATPTKVRS